MKRRVTLSPLATLVVLLVVVGCTRTTTPQAVEPQVVSTAPGSYPGGARLTLGNGASLIVPAVWGANLFTAGAVVTTSPALSGVIGAQMLESAHSNSLSASVYHGDAGFAEQMGSWAQTWRRSQGAGPGARFTDTRVVMQLDSETSTTAYVTVYPAGKPGPQVYMGVERRGADPLIIAAQLDESQPSVPTSSAADIPRRLLTYLAFQSH